MAIFLHLLGKQLIKKLGLIKDVQGRLESNAPHYFSQEFIIQNTRNLYRIITNVSCKHIYYST